MAFGQFMDHDLTQTPVFRGNDGSFLNCCQFFPLPKVNMIRIRGFLRGLLERIVSKTEGLAALEVSSFKLL